ncbi:MAG: hypothetical protein OXF41_02600 [bacterium]|nr:hypothetical protein [bacterium]
MTLAYQQSRPAQPLHNPQTRRLAAPPHSTEAEESVIGALLRSAQAADDVLDQLGSADFYVPTHQKIIDAMRCLYNDGQPIDTVTSRSAPESTGSHRDLAGPSSVTWMSPLLSDVRLRGGEGKSVDYWLRPYMTTVG